MKKEIMEIWVNALRSGKYKQGKSRLKTADQFCCLGVLCDISGLGEWDNLDNSYLRDNAVLPEMVMNWAGMRNNNGYGFSGVTGNIHLTHLNDKGIPFTEIADIIEKNWEKL